MIDGIDEIDRYTATSTSCKSCQNTMLFKVDTFLMISVFLSIWVSFSYILRNPFHTF
jgi:Fe-S oxidoreductase